MVRRVEVLVGTLEWKLWSHAYVSNQAFPTQQTLLLVRNADLEKVGKDLT